MADHPKHRIFDLLAELESLINHRGTAFDLDEAAELLDQLVSVAEVYVDLLRSRFLNG